MRSSAIEVSQPITSGRPVQRGRVLVVDDDDSLREVCLAVLNEAGFSAFGVPTGAECLLVLSKALPDLILLDIDLPDVDGRALCRRLKSETRTAELPVMHLSGDSGAPGEDPAGVSSVADGYILRPVSNHELVARIESTLRWKRTEAELRRVQEQLDAATRRLEQSELRYESLFAEDSTQRQESEERFRQLAENVDDAFWILDVSSQRMLYVNPAFQRMRGCPDEPMNPDPHTYLASIHPEDADRVIAAFETAPHAVNEEYRVTQPDGTIRWNWARTFPIHDSHGNRYRIAGIARDITERRRMEAQGFRAQRMESIGTLAGGIAHDLNNVLSPIIMAVELLRLRNDDPVSQGVLDTVESSARRGAEMVQQVLSFARGVEGERLLVQPKHLVKEMQKIVADAFPKNIEFKIGLKPDLWNVLGDPTQLHQVLLNLCVNARDAMPDGGRISVLAENVTLDEHFAAMHLEAKPGQYVVLEVQDSGHGMSAAVLEKIFDPFFTTKEVGKGTGLGLSTSGAIVKSHGGFILVSSEEGRGSTFRIHLPAQLCAFEPEADPPQPQLPRGHGELILVVDDEPSIRTVIQQTLEAFGYRVIVAADGVDAVSIYARQHAEIAAVIADMMMPIMDGPSMIQVLAKISPLGKVIAASGMIRQYQITKDMYPTVKDFLPKPYTTEEMLHTLAGVLAMG